MARIMSNVGKAKKSKSSKNDLLSKPKRPMSAYNFFFKTERAKILADDSSTDFGEIGRIIGQRWRNIEEKEHARYKELAKKDSERYRDEMKTFYKDELSLMCSGNAAQSAGKDEKSSLEDDNALTNLAVPASVSSAAGATEQAIGLPQATTASGQAGQLNTLLQQLTATQGMINPVQNTSCLPPSMAGTNDMSSANVMDDQVLQLLLQHQQSATSPFTSEAIVNLILSQKASIQNRQQKLNEELKTLQVKNALFDNILANERSKTLQQAHHHQPTTAGDVAASFSFAGLNNNINNFQTGQQLLPLLQQSTTVTNQLGAILGSHQASSAVNGQLFGASTINNAPGPAPPTPLLQGNHQQSTSWSSAAATAGVTAPTNYASTNNNTNSSPMTTANLAEQMLMMKNFLNENK